MNDILNAFQWYLAVLVIGLAAFPIAYRFLSRLPGKGYAFSKPLGLLVWGYLFWMLCEMHVIQNSIGGVYLALGLVICGSLLALRKGKAAELWQWIKENWKTVLSTELVFLIFFIVWAWIRSTNPEITGTEKPMEQAFISAILNSTSFPPKDPWLSGYAISYYYFGYVLIAMLIRISGVIIGVGYNLTSATWFALTATAAYGLTADLVAFWKRGKEGSNANLFTETQKAVGRTAGILGSILILIVSNLEGLLEVLHTKGVFWLIAADGSMFSAFWKWLGILDLVDPPPSNVIVSNGSVLQQITAWFQSLEPTRYLAWWRGSRVVRDLSINGNGIEIIDEFPFFSYLLSDLHPHVLAMPFDLLAIAICLNLFIAASENSWPNWKPLQWLKTWEFWLTALVLGSLAFINTWDFPIYIGLFCLVLIFLKVRKNGWSLNRIWDFLVACLTYGVAGYVLFLPFFLGFKSQAGGLLPSLEFQTKGVQFWIMFAPLMIPILFWLIHVWRHSDKPGKWSKGLLFTLYLIGGLWLASTLIGAIIYAAGNASTVWAASSNVTIAALGQKLNEAFGLLAGIHGSTDGWIVLKVAFSRMFGLNGEYSSAGTWLTLSVLLFFTWGLIAAQDKREDVETEEEGAPEQAAASALNANTFVLFLVLIGIGLSGFPQFFYLRDTFGNRMNTIFKFYFQTWIFWGIAAAYGTIVLWKELKGWRQVAFSTVWIVLFLSSLCYPVFMLGNKMDIQSFSKAEVSSWTLNGNAYLDKYYPDESAAIDWLKTAPDGVIVEAIGGSYSEYGQRSELTGKQTVLMWPGHEMQWRGGTAEMGTREEDVRLLYETSSWYTSQEILQKYGVRYVVVGLFEKNAYQVNNAKFNNNLNVVYQNNSVTIYEVTDAAFD